MMTGEPSGRVLQVNVSGGGVPKRPVERAWVGRFGLEGDAHRENTVHGGPHLIRADPLSIRPEELMVGRADQCAAVLEGQ